MLPIQTTHLRPRKFIFLIPLAFCIALFIIIGTQKNLPTEVELIFLIPLIILLIIWTIFRRILLTIDNEGLTYKSIFTTKQLTWNDVQKTYIKYKSHGKSGSHYWFFELNNTRFKFSTGLYSRRSLQQVAEAVVEKCKNTEIEERIYKMAEGKFPWYMF
jgi:hypothetical protein